MSQQDAQKTSFEESGQITLFYKKVVEDSEDVPRVASATETLVLEQGAGGETHTLGSPC